MSLPPSFLHQYSCSPPKKSPKRPWEDAQIALALFCNWSTFIVATLSSLQANLCYSDDTPSPAIVLLLWCYTPVSMPVSKCYSSCAMANDTLCLVPDCFDLILHLDVDIRISAYLHICIIAYSAICIFAYLHIHLGAETEHSGLPVWMSSSAHPQNLWS